MAKKVDRFWLMLIIGAILVVIPEPATTMAGVVLMLAAFGIRM